MCSDVLWSEHHDLCSPARKRRMERGVRKYRWAAPPSFPYVSGKSHSILPRQSHWPERNHVASTSSGARHVVFLVHMLQMNSRGIILLCEKGRFLSGSRICHTFPCINNTPFNGDKMFVGDFVALSNSHEGNENIYLCFGVDAVKFI